MSALLPPPIDTTADHIEAPPAFEPWSRPCVPPPALARCATPGCTRTVAHDGDRFCAACVADYLIGECHLVGCACGPCAVHGALVDAERWPHRLPEIARATKDVVPESLANYLARRDGGTR